MVLPPYLPPVRTSMRRLFSACFRLPEGHSEDAALEAGLHFVWVDGIGDAERALEGAIAALNEMVVLALIGALEFLLAADVSTSSFSMTSTSGSAAPGNSAEDYWLL